MATLRDIVKGTAGIGLAASALVIGWQAFTRVNDPIRINNPAQEIYQNTPGVFLRPHGSGELYISDEDGDGQADVLHKMTLVYWIAEGHKTNMKVDGRTRIMTPEIRKAATEAMKTDQNLGYLLHKRIYELQEETEQP